LTSAWATPDIQAITDLKLVPYGNTQYNAATGVYTCQHGADECASDLITSCVLYKLSGNLTSIEAGDTSEEAFPFVQCLEINGGASAKAESCYTSTMGASSLKYADVTTCVNNEAADVQAASAKATPVHQYTPWALVGGQLLEHTNLLVPAICAAYTGPAPASCKNLYARSDEKCMNVKA
jgi:Gamma interferon inducible lysosomal thiol reductase (GILT)